MYCEDHCERNCEHDQSRSPIIMTMAQRLIVNVSNQRHKSLSVSAPQTHVQCDLCVLCVCLCISVGACGRTKCHTLYTYDGMRLQPTSYSRLALT